MCNACAQPVQSMLKSRGHEHILCAALLRQLHTPAQKSYLSTVYTQRHTHHFSTIKEVVIYSVGGMFSTLYTPPITSTTKYINN